MFSALRRRLRVSPATVIAGLALVFAMTGGAYAAKKYLITSTKQISPSVLKALQGKAGPAGPAGAVGAGTPGAQGPAGPAGPAGAKGENGAPGAMGETGEKGKEGAKGETGKEGKVGKEGKEGKEGSPWAAGGTLPSHATETGVYSVTNGSGKGSFFGVSEMASISFTVPLAAPLDEHHVVFVHQPPPAVPAECQNSEHAGAASVSNPEASPGYLCVYEGEINEHATFVTGGEGIVSSEALGPGAGTAGALVFFTIEGPEAFAHGTWAVTAP